jgi:hypothetical protein
LWQRPGSDDDRDAYDHRCQHSHARDQDSGARMGVGFEDAPFKVRYNGPMDEQTRLQIEAAAFRRLVEHLRERTDVQNIDLMKLAGFCRNCLSKWYAAAAADHGIAIDEKFARELIYGMPYEEWKAKHQR